MSLAKLLTGIGLVSFALLSAPAHAQEFKAQDYFPPAQANGFNIPGFKLSENIRKITTFYAFDPFRVDNFFRLPAVNPKPGEESQYMKDEAYLFDRNGDLVMDMVFKRRLVPGMAYGGVEIPGHELHTVLVDEDFDGKPDWECKDVFGRNYDPGADGEYDKCFSN